MKKSNKILLLVFVFLIGLLCSLFFFGKSSNIKETSIQETSQQQYIEYHFRSEKLLDEHYKKHGIDMGFASKEKYEKAASDVANNTEALHKKESEDNDDVYYLEKSNEFVVVSNDGYIRTYFYPSSGKTYFDKQ